jgi:hypothetical protein
MGSIKLKSRRDKAEIRKCLNAVTHGTFVNQLKTQLESELSGSDYTSISVESFVRLMAWAVPKTDKSPYDGTAKGIHKLCDALFGYHDFYNIYSAAKIRELRANLTATDEAGLIKYHLSKVK